MNALKNTILLCVTVVILAIIGEYVVRYAYRDVLTTVAPSYLTSKWYKTIRTNRYGFREKDFEPKTGKGVYRIAVIGDSYAFGKGIDEKDRFSNLIEAELNKKGGAYEVLNFGRSGAETVDETLILKEVIKSAKPDFVLLQWYVNDINGHANISRTKYLRLFPSQSVDRYLMQSSVFYYIASRKWKLIQEQLGIRKSYVEYNAENFGDPNSDASKIYAQQLTDFIDLCKRNNIPVGIVLFPDFVPNLQNAYPFDYIFNRVIDICREKNIDCLDLRETFYPYTKNEKDCRKLHASRLDTHPSAYANSIATGSIMKKFAPGWLSRGSIGTH